MIVSYGEWRDRGILMHQPSLSERLFQRYHHVYRSLTISNDSMQTARKLTVNAQDV